MSRKIIQMLIDKDDFIYALCDDGTFWSFYDNHWDRLESIPQD